MKSIMCDLFGIKYPIFQGGMAWVSDASLASAVSNAGGLGIISAGNAPADYVREQIHLTKKAVGDKPFGVNIMMMSPFCDEIAQLVIDEKVPVVTTGAGLPTKYMKNWLEQGVKVVPVVPSVSIAKMVVRNGACAVIAEGGESGGHVGDLSTLVLVPQVCDAVDVPVIAAGGIGDGRAVAAALMLGACGVQLGTRFLVAYECTIHDTYKQKIIAANDISTGTTGRKLGHPVRALKTPFSRAFLKHEMDCSMSKEELEAFGTGSVRKAAKEGDEKNGSFLAGQICAVVKKEQSAREIIEELFADTDRVLRGASQWVK